jgi:hypothetical protein
MRAPRAILFAVTVAALTCVSAASASTSSYRDGPLTATFSAGTHTPTCKQLWPVTVTARWHGKPAHATAVYQFMLGGRVVTHYNPFSHTSRNRRNRIYHFYNRFTDKTFGPFGALAVGWKLTVRAVVHAGHHTAYPSYWVKVRRVNGCKAIR